MNPHATSFVPQPSPPATAGVVLETLSPGDGTTFPKKGEQITVIGTVKQPKAQRKNARGRKIDTVKLDIYIIEASQIIKGWGE